MPAASVPGPVRLVSLPFCKAILLDRWDAPPHRYFAAYRCRGSFRRLLGHAVIDEFASLSSPIFLAPRALLGNSVVDEFRTLSSPVFFAPHPLLGKIYDAGIGLGHRRHPEMGIDQGWPPLCVGLEEPAPELPPSWQDRLQAALERPPDGESAGGGPMQRAEIGADHVDCLRIGEAAVLVTSAPLLPKQLGRLCEIPRRPVTVAVATGNRIERPARAAPLAVTAVSEARLEELLEAARAIAT